MKVLIASDSYKYQTSGAANVVITLAEELRRRGHSVRVLALSNTKHSFRDGDDYYIRSLPTFVYPDVRYSLAHHDPLLRELREWNPDVIHMHTEIAAARMARAIARADHTPYVMTAHTDYARFLFGTACDRRPIRKIFREMGRYVFRGAAVITTPSEKALSFALLETVKPRIVVIPNGIRLEQMQQKATAEERAALFQQWNLKDNGRTVVIVSRLSKEKRLDEIITYFPGVLARVPDAQLLIVGDGPDRANLESLAEEKGIAEHVRFTGRIPPEEVWRYYDLGEVFVSASTFEVHSLTYLEAMARGLPLVCREDPCLRGVLEDGENGVAYRTQQEFEDSVVALLTDKELRGRMGIRSLEKSAEFSTERCADRMLELYQSVMDSQKQNGARRTHGPRLVTPGRRLVRLHRTTGN